MYPYKDLYKPTYGHTYEHISIHTYKHAYRHTYININPLMHVYLPLHTQYMCLYRCLHTYICVRIHKANYKHYCINTLQCWEITVVSYTCGTISYESCRHSSFIRCILYLRFQDMYNIGIQCFKLLQS